MKKILNAFFLTMIVLVTFSCSDVPSPYDINEGGSNENLVGTGTEEDPYDVASALVKADNTAIAWIYGYIVGGVVSDNSVTTITSPENVVFGTAGIRATTILVAASQDEKDYKNCLVVKLNGENTNNEVRTALNLQVNTSNLGKPVKIYGLLITKAFGRKGMTDTKAAILDGKKIGGEEEVPTDAYIYESFASSLGSFKSVSVSGTLSWYNDFSSAMVKGGSATEKFPSETWLVAPTIDLSAETAAYISFNHAINFADAPTIKNYHQLMISKDYTTDVAGATWTPLAITMASGNTFDFVNSGKVSIPAAFLGQSKVTVALKYTSTTTTGSTWEVQKFTVAHGEGGTIVDPIEPEFPTSGPGSKDEPYDVSTILTKQDDTKGWLKGFIVGGVNSAQTSATVDGPEDILFSVEGIRSSAIVIAASKDETDYKKCLVIGFGNDSGAAKTALNLVDHKDNLGKEVKLGGIFKNAFSAPGMKTITDYELVTSGTDPEEPGVMEPIFYESFDGEGGITKKKLADFVGYLDKSLTFSDSGIADIRDLTGNFNLWLPANKPDAVLITGFSTEGYKTLKLTYKIACFTKEVAWSIIKVKCGDTNMTIPEGKTVGSNAFDEVVIENVPIGITSISFVSDSENTQGFRIDDIKLEGTK